jgi:hypothetical protein
MLSEGDQIPVTFEIFNVFGKQIYERQSSLNKAATHILNLEKFVAGYYFLKISTKEKNETHRLIIAR